MNKDDETKTIKDVIEAILLAADDAPATAGRTGPLPSREAHAQGPAKRVSKKPARPPEDQGPLP